MPPNQLPNLSRPHPPPPRPAARLRPLRPIRTPQSENLDDLTIRRRGGEIVRLPPTLPFAEAYARLNRYWQVGQHFSLFAKTRSGKTTMAREILEIRDWVVVFGTKPRDEVLYGGFEQYGYVIKSNWEPNDLSEQRVIYRPGGGLLDTDRQAAAFTRVLDRIYEIGGWTVYIDEMLVLARDLGMTKIIDRMYTQAASNNVTMVAGSQRPMYVPSNMIDQSEWFALWKIADERDRNRAAEILGDQRGMALEAMKILPRYESLIVNPYEDMTFRTKVGL